MSVSATGFQVKCNCQHCNQKIEFESGRAGETIPCPHCSMETMLFIPPPDPKLVNPVTGASVAIPVQPAATKPSAQKAKRSFIDAATPLLIQFGAIALFVIGCGLVFEGCTSDEAESHRSDPSAIRQTVYVIQYVGGFLSIGLSAVAFGIGRVVYLKDKELPNKITQ